MKIRAVMEVEVPDVVGAVMTGDDAPRTIFDLLVALPCAVDGRHDHMVSSEVVWEVVDE